MVKADLILEEVEVTGFKQAYMVWKVKDCYVHLTDDIIRPLQSGEDYASIDDAKKEMEKRVLKVLRQNGRSDRADDIKWKITRQMDLSDKAQRKTPADLCDDPPGSK